jgi:hypothetical protein
MVDLVWIEPIEGGNGWWLKVEESDRFPNGKALELHKWRSMHDPDSIEELDLVLGSWGLERNGILYEGDDGKRYVPIAPSA